jgi:DNA-binding NtrC family response regulator
MERREWGKRVIVHFTMQLPVDLHREVQSLRRLYIGEALRCAGGNQRKAAELLGITRQGLAQHLREAEAFTWEIACGEIPELLVIVPPVDDEQVAL